MSTQTRVDVMICVPEQSTIERGSVFIGVIDVDIDHMPSQRIQQVEPFQVARRGQLQSRPEDHVELIIVVGNNCVRTGIMSLLMIRRDITKIPPAILVNRSSPSVQAESSSSRVVEIIRETPHDGAR